MQEPGPQRTQPSDGELFRDAMRQQLENARVQAQDGRVIVTTEAPAGVATTQAPPWVPPDDIPPRVQETAYAFLIACAVMVIGYPIAKAFGRRIDRAGETKVPAAVTSQLAQLNQAVESIAIEVERISEGQRFTTRLLSEQHQLPAPTHKNIS